MKKCWYFMLIGLLVTFIPIGVYANIVCNDGTISPSCTDCHQGCCSRHGGCSNNSYVPEISDNSSFNNSSGGNSEPVETPKSKDNSLKRVTVDYEEVTVANVMEYTTTNDQVTIYAVPNDDKAKVSYNANPNLSIGTNTISIKVTAEDGSVKNYKLNIIREKVLSSNTNIKVKVNDVDVVFHTYRSDVIFIENDEDKVKIEYELEDVNASAEVLGNDNLQVGISEITIKVVAENGNVQNYVIVVEKKDSTLDVGSNVEEIDDSNNKEGNTYVLDEEDDNEDSNNIGSYFVGVIFISILGYFSYKLVKKKLSK